MHEASSLQLQYLVLMVHLCFGTTARLPSVEMFILLFSNVYTGSVFKMVTVHNLYGTVQ